MDQLVSPSGKEWIAWFLHFSAPAALTALITLFLAAARNGRSNFKCMISPAIGLAGVFMIWLGAEIGDKYPKATLMENGARAGAIGLLVLALIVAILGLVEYSKIPRHSTKRAGARFAVVTAVLCALSLSALCLSIYTKKYFGQGNFVKVLLQPKRYRLIDQGFQIRPPSDWVQVDGSHLNPKASIAFTKMNPPLSFSIVSQTPGPGTPATMEDLVKLAQSQITAANTSAKFTDAAVSNDAGGAVAVFESRVTQNVFSFFYVHRLILSKGFAYQLITWGPANDPVAVRAGSEAMFAGFAVLR